MRDAEWDYVFLQGEYPEGSAVPEAKLAEMRCIGYKTVKGSIYFNAVTRTNPGLIRGDAMLCNAMQCPNTSNIL